MVFLVSALTTGIFNFASRGNERALVVKRYLLIRSKVQAHTAAAMNGLDAVIFTGGIGENAPEVRAAACSNLDILGIHIDAEKNLCRGILKEISTDDSKTKVYVIPTTKRLLLQEILWQLWQKYFR